MGNQESLASWIETLDKAGLLLRVTDEKRVDELPQLMEDHPDRAILVEQVKDSPFPFFANGMASREMCALALECDPRAVSREVGRRSFLHYPAERVDTAPCQDVILRGDEVDLTLLPLFLHHRCDGQAYITDGRVVSRDPHTGQTGDSIQRLMYRSKNMLNLNNRALVHSGGMNDRKDQALHEDMEVAILIGGPTLDQIASMMRLPGQDIDAWDKLGGYLGGPAQVAPCKTVDLTIPVNAEIVLEGHVITSEDFTHDEGPFGETMGSYGSAPLSHNSVMRVDCITYRQGAVYQYATVGGSHPGRTDMYVWPVSIEGELYEDLQRAGLKVLDVYMPPAGGEITIYASLKPVSGGDSKQALAIMLTGGRQQFPKVAYVFDGDIDIYDDDQVKWAQAWRFNPGTDILLIPGQNINQLDPSLSMTAPPYSVTKVGFDCMMPVGQNDARFARAVIEPPIPPPAGVKALTEDELRDQMTDLIRQAPRSWEDILHHFAGQPYPALYRAFGDLRPGLGRMADQGPYFPYVFSSTGDFVTGGQKAGGKS